MYDHSAYRKYADRTYKITQHNDVSNEKAFANEKKWFKYLISA